MATTKRILNIKTMGSVLGAIEPGLSRTDNKILQLNGKACDIFHIQTVTTPEVNCQLQTNLVRVMGGVVVNMTTGVIQALAVKPLATNAGIAVVTGSLPADNDYIALVYGTETRG